MTGKPQVKTLPRLQFNFRFSVSPHSGPNPQRPTRNIFVTDAKITRQLLTNDLCHQIFASNLEHTITIAEEAVVPPDGVAVGGNDHLAAAKAETLYAGLAGRAEYGDGRKRQYGGIGVYLFGLYG
jgi:hypothetical protein